MKTIEERAKEYSKKQCVKPVAYNSYIAGAKEQKAIDIEKACDWLEEHLYEEMFDLPFNNWIELFKKAMEE